MTIDCYYFLIWRQLPT